MASLIITFQGHAGDDTDAAVKKVLNAHGGKLVGCGTYLGEPMVRDIEFELLKAHVPTVKRLLKQIGGVKVSAGSQELAR